MSPITPLGKALSQSPLPGANSPSVSPTVGTAQAPISAFQWVSLAKASWTWILRPLWYLCFKWPSLLILGGLKGSDSDQRDFRKHQEIRIRRDERNERMKGW